MAVVGTMLFFGAPGERDKNRPESDELNLHLMTLGRIPRAFFPCVGSVTQPVQACKIFVQVGQAYRPDTCMPAVSKILFSSSAAFGYPS